MACEPPCWIVVWMSRSRSWLRIGSRCCQLFDEFEWDIRRQNRAIFMLFDLG